MVAPKEFRCENGHRMQYVREPHMRGYGHIYCNMCQRGPIDIESEGVYSCISCNYDACIDCYETATGDAGNGANRPKNHQHQQRDRQRSKEKGKPRLEPYQPQQKRKSDEEVHEDYSCDGCHKRPIVGNRHKCQVCQNYDLCSECYASGKGKHEEHNFCLAGAGVIFQVHRSSAELQEIAESFFEMISDGKTDELLHLFANEASISIKTSSVTFKGKEKITELLTKWNSMNFKVVDRLHLVDEKKQRIASQGMTSICRHMDKEERTVGAVCCVFGFQDGLISTVQMFVEKEILPKSKL